MTKSNQFEPIKTAVITGGLGFIGIHVTELMLQKGWLVYVIDKLTYAANTSLIEYFKTTYPKQFWFVAKDIRILEELPDCDVIVNLAASSHVARSIESSKSFLDDNIYGVQNLLELIRKRPTNCVNPALFLHVSTDECYGPAPHGVYFDENAPLNPLNPYSASKAAADLLIKSYHNTYNIDYNTIRPTNNYGLFQNAEKLIPLSVKQLCKNKKIKLHNHGIPSRTWLHANDTAQAILKIITSGKKNEIYNCSGQFEQTNIKTVCKIIECFFEGELKNKYDYELIEQYVDYSYNRQGQDIRYGINDNKLRKLGWTPVYEFDEEICGIVQYYKRIFYTDYRW